MSELFLFVIGSIVTLMVGSAIALLFYGASNESRQRPIRVEIVNATERAAERERSGPSPRSRRNKRAWTRSF